jgi:hypothetical protein
MGRVSTQGRLRSLDTLARQAQAILDHYPDSQQAADAVGVNVSTLYAARRGQTALKTISMRKIEEAYAVIQSLKRAEPSGGEVKAAVEQTLAERMAARFSSSPTMLVQTAPEWTVTVEQEPESIPQVEMRTCELCEREKPLAEGFYYKDDRGEGGYERLCKACSSRLRDRVQKALRSDRKKSDEERAALVVEHARQLMEARMAARGTSHEAVVALAARLDATVERFIDLAAELDQVRRDVAALS